MSSAQPSARPDPRIIIHHLSDLHFTGKSDGKPEETPENNRRNILVKYKRYLEKLPEDRRPDVVVITGDLTATGRKQDLDTVATILSNWFSIWENRLNEHVIIVPGPRDVNWEGAAPPGLDTFFKSLSDFALPDRERSPSVRIKLDKLDMPTVEFIAYLIDTCYSPDDLQERLRVEFTRYAKQYKAFVKRRAKLKYGKRRRSLWELLQSVKRRGGESVRATKLRDARNRFLALTEGAPPVALDSGRVTQEDVQRFQQWATTLITTQQAASRAASETEPSQSSQPSQDVRTQANTPSPEKSRSSPDPLKILITHHPLAIQPEQENKDGASRVALLSFQQVANTARMAGFHLALHGHIHKPQVLSDLSILEGLDTQHPVRQIGAASLGDTGLFNEITANYRVVNGKGIWRLELRLVDVTTDEKAASSGANASDADADRGGSANSADNDADGDSGAAIGASADSGSSFVLLNPAEAADNKVERLTRDLGQREEFDRRMRIAMRRYSELVFQTQNETRPEKLSGFALPQDTMQYLEGIIRDVIFDGFQVRTRLLLKNVETYRPLPTLTPKYLTPAVLEGPASLLYPASVAAWSLVLGRKLIYPDIERQATTKEDHEWLRRSDKMSGLLKALELLMQDEFKLSNPGSDVVKRFQNLHTNLTAIANNGDAKITGDLIYQKAPDGSPPSSFPYFICIPYPMRPPGGALPTVPEIAALDIGVRPMARPTSQRQPKPEKTPFTAERLDMLETITELIGLTLITSSALGKPPGVWDSRTRAKA